MKRQLEDYSLNFSPIPIFCDNTSAINLTKKNTIQHSKTKHIEIKHHFIRYHVHKGDIDLNFINIENQLANIFTKYIHEDWFYFIRNELGLINLD